MKTQKMCWPNIIYIEVYIEFVSCIYWRKNNARKNFEMAYTQACRSLHKHLFIIQPTGSTHSFTFTFLFNHIGALGLRWCYTINIHCWTSKMFFCPGIWGEGWNVKSFLSQKRGCLNVGPQIFNKKTHLFWNMLRTLHDVTLNSSMSKL